MLDPISWAFRRDRMWLPDFYNYYCNNYQAVKLSTTKVYIYLEISVGLYKLKTLGFFYKLKALLSEAVWNRRHNEVQIHISS